jgi:hypothetical protein
LLTVAAVLSPLLAGGAAAGGRLSTSFYSKKCPNVQSIVRQGMASAVAAEKRMGASILRMFFHDCFVNVGAGNIDCCILICHLFVSDRCMHCTLCTKASTLLMVGACSFVRLRGRAVTHPSCWTTRRP